MENIEQTILDTLRAVSKEEGLNPEQVQGDRKLVEDLGFRSLDMARIIAILDGKLDLDPFSSQVAVTSIRTVDDLCRVYVQCAAGEGDSTTDDSAQLDQAQRRAEARRNATQNRADAN